MGRDPRVNSSGEGCRKGTEVWLRALKQTIKPRKRIKNEVKKSKRSRVRGHK